MRCARRARAAAPWRAPTPPTARCASRWCSPSPSAAATRAPRRSPAWPARTATRPCVARRCSGSASAYLAARWKAHKDLEADYDRELRGARIAAYRALWTLLEPLARYAPPGPLTAAVAADLASALRGWYFQTGGLFLSDESRRAYFALQEVRAAALAPTPNGTPPAAPAGDPAGELGGATRTALRRAGSALRTATARDVGTRRTSEVLAA